MYQYVLMFIGLVNSIAHVLLVILYCIGLRLYKITDKTKLIIILKNLPKRSTITTDSDILDGYIWGWNYIGCITTIGKERTDIRVLYLMTTRKIYDNIIKRIDTDEEDTGECGVDMYDRTGNYYGLEYTKRMNTIEYIPTKVQAKVMKTIMHYYNDPLNKSRSVVCLLSGESGVGKSTVPFILANEMKGSICKSFNPIDPGDEFAVLYNTVTPSKQEPLIILIDEIDIIIDKVHNNIIVPHKTIPIKIKDKTSWNGFWDDINRGDYKYTIWILTTNKSPAFFDAIDPTYTRNGRVNIKYTMV